MQNTIPDPVANPPIADAGEADIILGLYGEDCRELTRLETRLANQIQALRERHQSDISDLTLRIGEASARLLQWAKGDRKNWGKSKFLDLLNGRMGFRTGKRTLDLRSKITWDKVLENCRPTFSYLIRRVESVDAQEILRLTGLPVPGLSATDLKVMGVKVVPGGEAFYLKEKAI